MPEPNQDKDPTNINLSDLNKPKTKKTLPKLTNPFKKQTGPHRDDEGKFATKSTTGSGGLTAAKQFNWKRAAPLMAIITIVGGLFVYQSFAASFQTRGRVKSGEALTCEQWGKPKGIVADPLYAGYGSGAPSNLKKIYRDFHRAALIEDDQYYWEVTRPAELRQEHAGDTMWLKCAVTITIFNEMVQATPAINTKEVVAELDIPTENIVTSIYAKDIRVGSQQKPLDLLPLQQTLGAMNGDLYTRDGVEHEYRDENFVRSGGNYLSDITFSKDVAAKLQWRDSWSAEKVKVCALVYGAGRDSVRPGTPQSVFKSGTWDRDYSKSPFTFKMKVDVEIEHRQTNRHDTKLAAYRYTAAKFKDLQDYNEDKKSFYSDWRDANSIVIPFAKFYVCSEPIEKTKAEIKTKLTRYFDATITQLKPSIVFDDGLEVEDRALGTSMKEALFERFDVVKVP